MAQDGNFMANYEPLQGRPRRGHRAMSDPLDLHRTHARALEQAAREGLAVVSSAHPRLVDGKPSKNPRYLQVRPDWSTRCASYVAEMGARFHRKLPLDIPVCTRWTRS
jgi:phosphoenolpyruvate carboxykinase (diphosphate)